MKGNLLSVYLCSFFYKVDVASNVTCIWKENVNVCNRLMFHTYSILCTSCRELWMSADLHFQLFALRTMSSVSEQEEVV